MVSESVQQIIKKVFPDLEILDYARNEAYITIPKLHPKKVQELLDATRHLSACVWHITGESHYGHVEIHFRNTFKKMKLNQQSKH